MTMTTGGVVVVTGANGFVGAHVCRALLDAGATVRAVTRAPRDVPRAGSVEDWVGDFADPGFAEELVAGATAVITTVHPMTADHETQRRVGVRGTATMAHAAARAGVPRLVHLSTTAVYERLPSTGDVDESSRLVPDTADTYPTSKRDAEAAVEEVRGPTRIVVRPPAVLGPGATSTWNTHLPARMRVDRAARHAIPHQTLAWVHVSDLARFLVDVATGRIPDSSDPDLGPLGGGCTPVNLAAGRATMHDYYGAVAGALGLEPTWADRPAWTGRVVATRARRWGWTPTTSWAQAMAELLTGVRA